MSRPSKYEERKFIFNLSSLVRSAFANGARPMQLNAAPDLVKKYERIIHERLLPPRGLDDAGKPDRRPWLRLDDAPALPFMADRSLKSMTIVLITDKDLPGVAVDLGHLAVIAPNENRVATVDERVEKDSPTGGMRKESGLWSGVKDRIKGIFS